MKSYLLAILALGAVAAASPRFYHPEPPATLDADADSSHSWDALHYELLLTVTPFPVVDSVFISGVASIVFTPVAQVLDTVDLHFVGLQVTDIDLDGVSCTSTRIDCLLYVALPGPHHPGETLQLNIDYNGVPVRTGDLLGGVGIFHPSTTMIYTQADPRGLRNWMPCWDEPWDKATFRQKLVFQNNFVVAANGTLEQAVVGPEWTQWIYAMNQPIATYLVSFCASNYATFQQSAGAVAIKHFVYPQHLAAAQVDFQRVPEMIQTYSDFFGPYPFPTFGYAEAPVFGNGGGAMENQTMVTYGNLLITGSGAYEDVAAHELSHQWFGNAVGYIDWPEMWLSEGFATYSEALWHQHLFGLANYFQKMLQFQQAYISWENPNDSHPMYDPPWNIIWSELTYEKGASVLHMLRYELGDSLFFQALRDHVSTYRYGNTSTQDLSEVVQNVSGEAYGWFFDQWVYQSGYPSFQYFVQPINQGGEMVWTLSVAQVQSSNFPRFQTHADLYVFFEGDTLIQRVTLEALPTQQIALPAMQDADSMQLDPLSWILGPTVRRDDLSGPVLAASDAAIADEGGDGFLDPGETGELSFILANTGFATGSLTVTLTSMDAQLQVVEGTRQISGLGFYAQHDFAADPFVVENDPISAPRWVEFRVQARDSASGSLIETLWLYLPVGTPELLLVDDDAGDTAEVKHQQALDAIRRVYRTVEYVSADSLPPLGNYLGVVWACGAAMNNTLTAADQAVLQAYFNQGGSLFLSGRGVVPDLAATGFFQNTLHARSEGNTSAPVVYGADPLLEGLEFFIAGEGSALDVIEPDGAAGSGRLLTYPAGTGAAVKYDGAYKATVLGFGFENVASGNPNFAEPEDLLGPLMAWFTGTPGVELGGNGAPPKEFKLGQNFPNPFNAETVIPLELPQRSAVQIELFNLRGQSLGRIYDGVENAGWRKIRFSAAALPSGIYFYRLKALGLERGTTFENVGKMLLVK